ncbi:MAG: hypothetical protein U5K31_02400 [Balneolaceae bacterium]|nr:hypothetical protein [Balneolaceae bacterium]
MNLSNWLRKLRRMFSYLLPVTTLRTEYESPATLSDRSMRQFEEARRLYRDGTLDEALEQLSGMAFLSSLPDNFLHRLLEEAAGTRQDGTLRSLAGELSPALLPAGQWLQLYQACFRSGLLQTAGILRRHARQSAVATASSEKATPEQVECAFRALVDAGRLERARRELDRLEELVRMPQNVRTQYRVYLHLSDGNLEEAVSLAETLPGYHVPFRRYLEGRSVAVAGPAASEEQMGPLIDSFDVVVRMNYGRRSGAGDPAVYGSRTDVSYYNRGFLDYLKREEAWDVLDELDHALFRCRHDDLSAHLQDRENVQNPMARLFYFSGFPNLGQLSIADLLLHRPARLKIFHMNFYYDSRRHHDNYFLAHDHRNENHLRSLAVHDCLSQLGTMRNFRNSGLIEADPACGRVLDMDEEDYLSGLETFYAGR